MSNWPFLKGSAIEVLGKSGGSGTGVLSGATAGAKSLTYTTIGTTGFNWDGMCISVGNAANTLFNGMQLDIALGGTPDIVISDLFSPVANRYGTLFFAPIKVPTGTAVKAQLACSTGATTFQLIITGFQGGTLFRGMRKLTGLQVFSAGLPTTTVSLPGSTSASAFATLVASTAEDYCGLMIQQPLLTGTALTAMATYDLAIGAAASEQVIYTGAQGLQTAQATMFIGGNIFLPCDIPAGSRISMRCQAASGTSTVAFAPIIMGLAA